MAKKKSTVKKQEKKNIVKEEVKEEIIVPESEEPKKECNRILSDRTISMLYAICAFIWGVSAIIDYVAKEIFRGSINLVVAIALFILAVVYYKKMKKEKID